MPDDTLDNSLEMELLELAEYLEDYDPSGAFCLSEDTGYFSEISFRLPVYLKSGRVSLIEAHKISHGPTTGRFLMGSAAVPKPAHGAMRRSCLERTVRSCLHGLDWRGSEVQVRCDPREISPDVTAHIGSALAQEALKHSSMSSSEFLLPWRRLPTLAQRELQANAAPEAESEIAQSAAKALGVTSPVDLYETALLSIYPTACASRGLKMDDCTTLVRGRGSWAFKVAEAIQKAFGAPVRVEVAGRRYRPGVTRSSAPGQSGSHQQGRWETDEREASAQPEVIVLLGGGEAITPDRAGEIKSCLLFHLHRESLTADGETALRARGIVVVPRLLLCSVEELAADSLSDPAEAAAIEAAAPQELEERAQKLRSTWRQKLLAAWERILAKTKEEQCSAHHAAVRLSAQCLIEHAKRRLRVTETLRKDVAAPSAGGGGADSPEPVQEEAPASSEGPPETPPSSTGSL
jgi:glutamate dehydrogenase/leucine dehydrogenase